MTHLKSAPKADWLVDYSARRARAIQWLGDRYLLARPINRNHFGAGWPKVPAATPEGEGERSVRGRAA
jgi:hypothetical protein